MSRHKSILVIIGHWPSKTHPYLVWLFYRLKQEFPGLHFYQFGRPEHSFGEELIGAEALQQTLAGSLYRSAYSRNPLKHLRALLSILRHFRQSRTIYEDCRRKGLRPAQCYGQLYYHHQLLGRHFDLVHINALQTARHLPSNAFFGKAKVLASSRGQDFDFYPDRYDAVLQRINHLHVLGDYLKAKARSRGYTGPVSSIPPAFPPLNHQEQKKPRNTENAEHRPIVIATAARLTWVKGHDYALHAIHQLKTAGFQVRYLIFGQGPELEKLQFLVEYLRLKEEVVFAGWFTEKQLLEALKEVDIYLLLPLSEAFNNSVLLAQALGIPCVVSDAGGLPENVENGVSGWVVPRYDVPATTQALITLIQNPALRIQMSAQARRRVSQKFSLDQQVTAYAKLYEILTKN